MQAIIFKQRSYTKIMYEILTKTKLPPCLFFLPTKGFNPQGFIKLQNKRRVGFTLIN